MNEAKEKEISNGTLEDLENLEVRLIKNKNWEQLEFEKAQSILSDIMMLSRKKGRPHRKVNKHKGKS